jgi:hypothetical protein
MNHHNLRESRIEYRVSSIDNPTLAQFRHFSSLFTNLPLHLSRILYKSTLFMQNKPNVKNAQINVSSFITIKYVKVDNWCNRKNKPNSNPIKPNLPKCKIDAKCVFTKDYRKNGDFVVRINKPNFFKCQNERKLNFNKGLQKKRFFSIPKNKPNTNPIRQACVVC